MIWRMSTTEIVLRIILRTVQTIPTTIRTIQAKTVLRILLRTTARIVLKTAQILQTTIRTTIITIITNQKAGPLHSGPVIIFNTLIFIGHNIFLSI